MKRKAGIVFIICMLSLFCSACQVQNVTHGMNEGEHYDAVVSVKGNETEKSDSKQEELIRLKSEFDAITALLGKVDEEAAAMLGGGSETRTEDGYLVGRSYQTMLFDRECFVVTSYGEAETVEMIFAGLSGDDISGYKEKLDLLLGSKAVALSADETQQGLEEDENGWLWNVGKYAVTLYESEEAVSLDIVLNE
ncbi:MAG: hypothetical protein IJ390_12045 [Lachnospiraceae bacterium]|nr:hypothetical protein [Lachnospiraceae bacterium]